MKLSLAKIGLRPFQERLLPIRRAQVKNEEVCQLSVSYHIDRCQALISRRDTLLSRIHNAAFENTNPQVAHQLSIIKESVIYEVADLIDELEKNIPVLLEKIEKLKSLDAGDKKWAETVDDIAIQEAPKLISLRTRILLGELQPIEAKEILEETDCELEALKLQHAIKIHRFILEELEKETREIAVIISEGIANRRIVNALLTAAETFCDSKFEELQAIFTVYEAYQTRKKKKAV